MSEERHEDIMVSIHKKGDWSTCNNYLKITLSNIKYKVLSDLLSVRKSHYAKDKQRFTLYLPLFEDLTKIFGNYKAEVGIGKHIKLDWLLK